MKKLLLLSSAALALAACAPRQGIPPTRYAGESGAILAAISQIGTQLRPTDQFNNFSVEAITQNGVTFYTENTLGSALFFGRQQVRMTFTALQSGNTVNVAGSINIDRRDLVEAVFRELDKSFQRVP